MVALQQPFNAHAVPPATRPEPIDDSWQPAVMVASELKPTKANDGGFFEFVFDIIDGPHKGRKMYARLNVYNNNEQAVEIARGQLSAICWCTGQFNLQDTSQLHNIPLQIYVVKRKNERDGGMSNDVVAFRDIHGNEPWKNQGGQPQQPQQQPQGGGGGWSQQPQPQTQPAQPQQGGWQQPQQPQGQPPASAPGWQQNPPQSAPAGPPQGGGGWQGQAPANQQPQGGGNGQWQQPQQQQQQQQPQGGGQQQPWQGTPPSSPPWQQR